MDENVTTPIYPSATISYVLINSSVLFLFFPVRLDKVQDETTLRSHLLQQFSLSRKHSRLSLKLSWPNNPLQTLALSLPNSCFDETTAPQGDMPKLNMSAFMCKNKK